MHYEIVVRAEAGQFRAICPQIAGVVGYGTSAGAALDAAIAALQSYCLQHNLPTPQLEVTRANLKTLVGRA
ncbi:hypothetical protein [Herpetosiphon giganteus]|uniref:hypothetical protein n=1 Tax=Herpetosiphon giganteus TaxID=2029754 RepID=UPI00195608EC|nr:hypothetical protein [Herpetosiphon giganteus]MBM7842346.1 putative RNase H-like HicB family nuclease [Herpetosiphon giganteus]